MTDIKYTAEQDSSGAWITSRSPRVYTTAADAVAAAEEADRCDARRAATNARRATAGYEAAMARIAQAQASAPTTTEASNTSSTLYGRGVHHAGDGFTTYESPVTPGRYSVQIWDES